MKRNPEAICKTCPYYHGTECRAKPPKVFQARDWEGYEVSFPPVLESEWCGNHPEILITNKLKEEIT